MQPAQLGAGLDTQVAEGGARDGPIQLERVPAAPGVVQRPHQLPRRPLGQRIGPHDGTELDDQLGVPPEFEIGVDAGPVHGEAEVFELGRPQRVGHAPERGPLPQRERLGEQRGRDLGRGDRSPVQQGVRAVDVDPVGVDVEPVPRRGGEDAGAVELPQDPPQVRDVAVDDRPDGRGRVVPPERVDDVVERDDLARFEGEHREQTAHAGTADRDGVVAVDELNGPEQPEPDRGHARAHLPGVHGLPASPSPGKSTYRDRQLTNTTRPGTAEGRYQEVWSLCGFRSAGVPALRHPCTAGDEPGTPDVERPRTTGPDPVVRGRAETPGRAARGRGPPVVFAGDRAGELTPSEAPAVDRPRRRLLRGPHARAVATR